MGKIDFPFANTQRNAWLSCPYSPWLSRAIYQLRENKYSFVF